MNDYKQNITNLKKIQDSMYEIATAAHTIKDSYNLYKSIHKIIKNLMYAENIYIALYDKKFQTLKFEYYVDIMDKDFSVGSELKLSKKNVTSYCIKEKKSVLLTKEKMIELTNKGTIKPVGSISETWLGVPLISQGNIIGVITVQSYDSRYILTEKDKQILSFVSELLAMSIEQKKLEQKQMDYQENLERDVEGRTKELFFAKEKAEEATLAKTQFLANMSHELRTPLNAIIGYSEILIEDANESNNYSVVNDLNKILKSGKHLLSLINEVLDLSKIEANKLDINLNNFKLQDIVKMIEDAIIPYTKINNNKLKINISKKSINIYSDELKFKQILFNLLTNACKYSENSLVAFSLKEKTINKKDYIEATIKDKGIGIAKNEINAIFEPFTRVNKENNVNIEGTGLGLAITKAYVDLLGGSITVSSRLGIGSSFSCSLPVNYYDKQSKISLNKNVDLTTDGNKDAYKIFIVDDDIKYLDVINRKLVNLGYSVKTTNSGVNAISKIIKYKPDIIIIDIIMPDVDGWTLYNQIKENNKLENIPIIVVTVGDYNQMSQDLGANGFIKKPIEWNSLYTMLLKYNLKPHGEILVIDDDNSTRSLLDKMISKEGWQVQLAENGKEAIQKLKKGKFQLILLDLLMPIMDGFEFLKKIKNNKKYSNIPVVVITSKDLTKDDYDTLRGDVVRIVQKGSYKSDEILEYVNRIIRNKK